VLPFLEAVTHHCKPRELTVAMAAAYDLDEAGIAFVTGSGESTNKVASIAEDAQALREERMEDHAEGASPPAAATQRTTSERRTARRRMRAVQRAVPATTGTRTGQPTATEAMLTTGTTTMTTGAGRTERFRVNGSDGRTIW